MLFKIALKQSFGSVSKQIRIQRAKIYAVSYEFKSRSGFVITEKVIFCVSTSSSFKKTFLFYLKRRIKFTLNRHSNRPLGRCKSISEKRGAGLLFVTFIAPGS
jgi:hypothetical protein